MPAPDFRIVIPTRDSGRWIGHFVDFYRDLGVEPLFLVDTRTSDDTADILRNRGMEVIPVSPAAERAEAVIVMIPTFCRAQWVLRINDDELPSRSLIRWIKEHLRDVTSDAVAISRRPLLLSRDGVLRYSRMEVFYWNDDRPDLLDPQIQLFQTGRVTYRDQLHTPGIEFSSLSYAPPSAFIAHFDWIVRSTAERIRKLRRYEAQRPGGGLDFAQFYLPECLDPAGLRETPLETTEFDALAAALSRLPTALLPRQQTVCDRGQGAERGRDPP